MSVAPIVSCGRMLQEVTEDVVEAVKSSLHIAIQAAPDWAKAWHNWGLFNVNAMDHYKHDVATANRHVAPAVAAFFKSVSLSQASGGELPTFSLQPITS